MSDLITALGPTLVHVTPASNLPLIRQYGLMPAAQLAARADQDASDIMLRKDRRVVQTDFGRCTLNHQKPIVHGTVKQGQSLDGISREDWARQLDERVFFWPGNKGHDFAKSIASDTATATINISTARFLERFAGQIDLAPINTGNFRQGGANTLRGDWIYVPATDGYQSFRKNRQARGLVKTPDVVKEISLRGAISADDLADLRVDL
ncbi:DUF7002 family protein [Roseobacter sp. CCS2]|uniref:DUF7002 family protein n=1 Tax=Roseobacter sp. CCS2 TaxID=391593 RepID=UPI0000F3C4F9|nr:hypothetical protein [Roseobacter sp. CCS2]EBA11728.1 hypothetical protein RCCS2_17406 [Roseobacter sp. CCS2]